MKKKKGINISKNSSAFMDKFIQSKISNDDDIEEKYSFESSKKINNNNEKGAPFTQSHIQSVEEDSSLKKYDLHSNRKKESSNRSIKEEYDDGGFEPVDY